VPSLFLLESEGLQQFPLRWIRSMESAAGEMLLPDAVRQQKLNRFAFLRHLAGPTLSPSMYSPQQIRSGSSRLPVFPKRPERGRCYKHNP
jgi:hypothetical protein